uniref:Similarity. Hypothetical start n=1 Tax=Microcystis aeruginosa (strain PCC 7806) TaxID=267872 RepID=A8YI77_MICA7|nr:unnamed protein product [Microcystis aeruginosa PCC 7806]
MSAKRHFKRFRILSSDKRFANFSKNDSTDNGKPKRQCRDCGDQFNTTSIFSKKSTRR